MQANQPPTLPGATTAMHPVRRGLKPLTIATLAAALAPAASAAPAPSTTHGCKAGAITTSADQAHTFVCDRSHALIETAATIATPEDDGIEAPTGGATLHAKRASRQSRCAAGDHTARAGRTLVTITTALDGAGHTTSTSSTAYICGADGAWRQIASQSAAITLIPTSLVIERTETTR